MADYILMDADSLDHTSEVLDEVLQQASAQALRLSHVDESLVDIRQSIGELRSVVVGGAKAESNTQQLDNLEHETKALKGRLALLTGFSILQLLALGALMLFALQPMPHTQPVEAPVAAKPAPPVAPPAPTSPTELTTSDNLLTKPPAVEEKPAAPPVKTPVGKKKKH